MKKIIAWKSVKFKEADVVSTYGRLHSDGKTARFFDVNLKGKTIREYSDEVTDPDVLAKFEGRGFDMTHVSGLTLQERKAAGGN